MKLNSSAVMQSHMKVWFGFQILYWVSRFYICNWCRGIRPPLLTHAHTHTHTVFRLRCVFQIGKNNSFIIVVLLSTNVCVSEKYPLNSLLWFSSILDYGLQSYRKGDSSEGSGSYQQHLMQIYTAPEVRSLSHSEPNSMTDVYR